MSATSAFINCQDPDAPGSGGFFSAEESFASNNLTPQGLAGGDDNDFVTVARTFIQITAADDYTFGFSSSEGARLRVFGASFTSSARLNPFNPANPAHSGDTLSYPGLTGNADTLGVCFLQPGVYPVEFVTWERDGGAYCEVFAARGARTTVDSAFRLIGDTAPGGTLDYVVNGRMIGGFAIIAAPAQYGSTGIKTFMISHDGVVWEQDLGPNTAREAAAITTFDPAEGWSRVAESFTGSPAPPRWL